jgi:hypothetical protein
LWNVIVCRYLLEKSCRRTRLHGCEISDGQTVGRGWSCDDRVAGPDVTRLPYAQVGTGPSARPELLDKPGIPHTHPELEARLSRLGHLKHCRSYLPPLANETPIEIHADRGQVLAECSGTHITAENG